MADAKLIVMYPHPKNAEQFESLYHNETVAKISGKTKIVATKVLDSGWFHRIAEIHFPSMQILRACAASEGGKQVLANAMSISTGGPPVILIAEEETFTFGE